MMQVVQPCPTCGHCPTCGQYKPSLLNPPQRPHYSPLQGLQGGAEQAAPNQARKTPAPEWSYQRNSNFGFE